MIKCVLRKYILILLGLFVLLHAAGAAEAEPTSLAWLFANSTFNVVSTERKEAIAPLLETMNVRIDGYYSVRSYKNRAMQLNKTNMLVIVDRQKLGADFVLLERLVGVKSGEIGKDEVLVQVLRRPREGYRVLFTSPTQAPLHKELDTLFALPEYRLMFEDTGLHVLRRFNIVGLSVISDLEKEQAADWIGSISVHGGDVYDWTYTKAAKYSAADGNALNYLLLIDSSANVSDALAKLLDEDFADWLKSPGRLNQQACRRNVPDKRDKPQVYAFAAPGKRHLGSLLYKYNALAEIPEELTIFDLRDLLTITKLGITLCRKDTTNEVLASAFPIFVETLKTSLSSMRPGFELLPMQDVSNLNACESNNPAGSYKGVDGIAILQITDFNGPSTPAIAPFSLPKPKAPTMPQKSEKNYSTKMKKYNAEMQSHKKALASWESKEKAHRQHATDTAKRWFTQEYTDGDCSISGTFRVLKNTPQGTTELIKMRFYGSVNENVTRKPSITQAFLFGCRDLAQRLKKDTVFPSDIQKPERKDAAKPAEAK